MFATATITAACGGDDGGGTKTDAAVDVGFNKPAGKLVANSGNQAMGDVDLTSCATDAATTAEISLTTKVVDFQNQTPVPSATVTAFQNIDVGTAFATATSDGTTGNITMTIPTGTKRYGFKMTADGQFPTLLLNQYFADGTTAAQMDPTTIQSVSNSTAQLLPAIIGQTRTAGTGVVAGALRDCNRHEISNFVATVSSTSQKYTPLAGESAFYFSLDPELPVHHTQAESAAANGLFMVIQVPATDVAYVQAWGFPTDADVTGGEMKLISELKAPVIGDTVVTGSFEPIHN
ncbi:MAG: hypothetical protein QM831_05480 [Kofleriaceae bacterium]